MKIKRPIEIILAICFGLLLMTISAYERPAYGQCEAVTDAQLVDEIYAKFKAHGDLAKQLSHINVISINRVIKLQGWTDSKGDYKDAFNIVASTKCVVMINVQLFRDSPPAEGDSLKPGAGGCQAGTKPCGDICIPEGDTCNIAGRTKNE